MRQNKEKLGAEAERLLEQRKLKKQERARLVNEFFRKFSSELVESEKLDRVLNDLEAVFGGLLRMEEEKEANIKKSSYDVDNAVAEVKNYVKSIFGHISKALAYKDYVEEAEKQLQKSMKGEQGLLGRVDTFREHAEVQSRIEQELGLEEQDIEDALKALGGLKERLKELKSEHNVLTVGYKVAESDQFPRLQQSLYAFLNDIYSRLDEKHNSRFTTLMKELQPEGEKNE